MTAGLDLDALTAIDVHVHAEVSSQGGASLPPNPGASGMITSNFSESARIAGRKRGEPPLPCSTSMGRPAPARFIEIDAPQRVVVE